MSHSEKRNWLVAYDIADPRRLVRVHRYLKAHAIPVQYSIFVLQGNQMTLNRVLGGIAERIAPDEDDVRAYHLPNRCEVAMLGTQQLPDGVVLGAHGLDRLLRELTTNDDRPIVEWMVDSDERMHDSCLDGQQES